MTRNVTTHVTEGQIKKWYNYGHRPPKGRFLMDMLSIIETKELLGQELTDQEAEEIRACTQALASIFIDSILSDMEHSTN